MLTLIFMKASCIQHILVMLVLLAFKLAMRRQQLFYVLTRHYEEINKIKKFKKSIDLKKNYACMNNKKIYIRKITYMTIILII